MLTREAQTGLLVGTTIGGFSDTTGYDGFGKPASHEAFKPKRDREVSVALRAYAAMTTSAAQGAVRDVTQIEKH